jgi:glyoxylase I family protein
MMCKFRLALPSYVFVMFTISLVSGCSKMKVSSTEGADAIEGNRIRLEHIAINVEDPVSMAKWYGHNLGMKVVRKGPPPVNMHFISDAGGNMMLEIYHNPSDAVPNYSSMDPLLLHIAFMVDDVKRVREKLIVAGATAVGEVTITPVGDELAMLRDPWGVAIQFVKRAKPMLRHR